MRKNGFTLAELLIALAILGVIATFTIPKVLQSQAGGKDIAITKEIIATVSGAMEAYRAKNTVGITTRMRDLTPYMNYIHVDSTGNVDGPPAAPGSLSCAAPVDCIRFANGTVLAYDSTQQMDTVSGDPNELYLVYIVDPDGQLSGTDSLMILIRPNGLTTSSGTIPGQPLGADPAWFSWN